MTSGREDGGAPHVPGHLREWLEIRRMTPEEVEAQLRGAGLQPEETTARLLRVVRGGLAEHAAPPTGRLRRLAGLAAAAVLLVFGALLVNELRTFGSSGERRSRGGYPVRRVTEAGPAASPELGRDDCLVVCPELTHGPFDTERVTRLADPAELFWLASDEKIRKLALAMRSTELEPVRWTRLCPDG